MNGTQKFYGDVTRGNTNDLVKMKERVFRDFFPHKGSTDEAPVHNLCRDDLCPIQEAVVAGTVDTYGH